ncbi:TspO and MBR related proteins [Kaistia soli DSM 19436]|uniref:TspO and MBR related proteins n=1 Tax=Kaistia soli DSM 19436 TaxID=1122133 RepID=A0A1M5C903_9HYPH|nr:TspO/MBR family protein [Kaistia soli]SHF51229.1 TspO and MBR related proteins [Kaistia soli DSM 19436]
MLVRQFGVLMLVSSLGASRLNVPASRFPIVSLIACLVVCFAAAAIGSAATLPSIPIWYEGLAKPDFNPPNWLFGPVWTILYALMAVALWRVVNNSAGATRRRAVAIFSVQLILNAAWSVVFFGLHSITGGLITIALLDVAILATIAQFGRIDRLAGWLLVPYVIWVSFAALLNLAIFILN